MTKPRPLEPRPTRRRWNCMPWSPPSPSPGVGVELLALRRQLSVILTPGLFATMILGATACSGEANRNPPVPTASKSTVATSSSQIDVDMPQFLEKVDQANVEVPGTLVRSGARPTVNHQESGKQAMVIRDEDRSDWAAGNYRLVVYCVGSGTLYAHLKIGESSEISELSPCAPDVTTGTVDVRVNGDSVGATVTIIPAGDVKAAVAYQIQRG